MDYGEIVDFQFEPQHREGVRVLIHESGSWWRLRWDAGEPTK
jgi:hypothetical protein